ncbi:MAG: flagellar basal-body rod protein FlgF [Fibrobacterota bacterium]
MLSGISHAVQGMTVQMKRQDQIANNLANVNTTGYKRKDLFASSIERYFNDDKGRVSGDRVLRADEVYTDYTEGALEETGKNLDLALKGKGFFTAMTAGGVAYTRDGSFSLDESGFLVTGSGDRVFGNDGFIRINREGGPVSVRENGAVMQDGSEIDSLRISDFNEPYKLLNIGSNYYRPEADISGKNTAHKAVTGFSVKQGFLERSNVDPVTEMTDMISSHRIYEAVSKAMKSEDETLDKSVNSVGRVG